MKTVKPITGRSAGELCRLLEERGFGQEDFQKHLVENPDGLIAWTKIEPTKLGKVTVPETPATRLELLQACQAAGIKLWGGTPERANCSGEELPLSGGLPELLWSLDELDQRQVASLEPYGHDYKEQMALGQGPCSVEETLAHVLLYWQQFQCMPAKSGWLRCRNRYDSGHSLCVDWGPGDGLYVSCHWHGYRDPRLGALLRK